MKDRIRVNGFIIFSIFITIGLFPDLFFRNEPDFSLDIVAKTFGLAFILLGQIFRLSARGFKSEHSRQGHLLIEGGPYALVRNPMYLGILLIGFGIVLILFQWWLMCLFIAVFILRYLLLMLEEEKKLAARFGDLYQNYRRAVPRIFPTLNKASTVNIAEYLPIKPPWIKRELSTMATLLFIALILEAWQELKNKGALIYLKELMIQVAVILLFVNLALYLLRHTLSPKSNVSA
jgi:protein-S-isoprenylcysteine O-methyltransferase Ste14